jgi:hypothetical protein
MSHAVHGSWQDLLEYQLDSHEDGTFTPVLEWHPVRPQVLLAIGTITVDTLATYLEFIAKLGSMEDLGEKLDDLKERLSIVNVAHESYLSGRQ